MTSLSYTLVNVAVNRPMFRDFVYKIAGVHTDECLGSRVSINFAGSNDIGVITSLCSDASIDEKKLKEATLIDEKSFITAELFQTLQFGSNYYQYPLGQCFNVALPKLLREGRAFNYESIPALRLKENVNPLALKRIKSQEQQQIINILAQGNVRRKELRERGFSSQQETALIKKGIIELIEYKAQYQTFYDNISDLLKEKPPIPNLEQQNAIHMINSAKGFKVFLVNGVTGSGKTEIYLRVIEEILKKGKSVFVLVPEIALTPQTFERFYRRFNTPVATIHSALSDRERLDAYIDMYKERAGILIGTRTSLFTPIKNLGLIVIDEEHDSSFKQTETFRYHARNLAIMRAKINNCPIILGSATPSLESFYNAYNGLYTKIDLTTRAGGATMPGISLIDLKNEPLTEGIKTGISASLENEIGEETAKGNQVLLFLNRRGFSHHLVCHKCGYVFMCPHCDNLLTVHKNANRLLCHVCENSMPLPHVCPQCHEASLLEQGFGTEQVYEYLHIRYPDINIERIDRDTITNKNQLEQRLKRIRSGESQIMIGTQILAKGHDFPNVTLVGILDIDSALFSDDFRALETTTQLITQVSGRAGRGQKKGRVIIQTHHNDNFFINLLISPHNNYDFIASELLKTRKKLSLPPYTNQAFILSNSADRNKAFAFIKMLEQKIALIAPNYANVHITNAMSDKMEKQQNRYHFHILASCENRVTLNQFLNHLRQIVYNNKLISADVRFAIEIDPIFMY